MAWFDQPGRIPDPSPDEFAGWVPAQEVFGPKPKAPDQQAITSIVKRLKSRVIFGAAGLATWRVGSNRVERRHLVSIDPAWWDRADEIDNYYDPLWVQGEATAKLRNWPPAEPVCEVRFFEIRFEPTTLRAVNGVPRPNVSKPEAERDRSLTDAKAPTRIVPSATELLSEAAKSSPVPLSASPSSAELLKVYGYAAPLPSQQEMDRLIIHATAEAKARELAAESQAVTVEEESAPHRVLKKPRGVLSDAALNAWWAVFDKYTPDATEEQTRKSVEAMFPNHSVSRDRVRDLRGRRKPGPRRGPAG